ncbi:DUF6924 domain-containing protein [Paractinoplanes hotanensis]|uniref:DUF6924 domain-containing protein n=1 Tax=Paractinoplanes hotanensis TaxID=2906497 RepID=A0ABT0YC18_9ACTN|nr:hypothetical protein [Actinoplanes hotanensis]MCM4083603.1 hypothetical protein [Actinoplanes hotanensis]
MVVRTRDTCPNPRVAIKRGTPSAAIRTEDGVVREEFTFSRICLNSLAPAIVSDSVRLLPGLNERKNFGAVVVRTDYSDEAAWRAFREMVRFGNDAARSPLLVDDSAWADATVDEVLAVGGGRNGLDVVFVADRAALADPEHALLVVAVAGGRRAGARPEAATERAFRIVPAWVTVLEDSLAIGAVELADYAEAAAQDSAGVFRGFAA